MNTRTVLVTGAGSAWPARVGECSPPGSGPRSPIRSQPWSVHRRHPGAVTPSTPHPLAAITGIVLGLPGCYAVRHLARHSQIWTFLGYPTYGAGPFEVLGVRTTTAALAPSGP